MSLLALSICLPQRTFAQGAPIGGTASVKALPNPSATSVGGAVVVALRVGLAGLTGKSASGSSTPVVLGGYQIVVSFDKTRLRLDSVAGGTSAGYTSAPTFTTLATANSNGSVTLVASQTSPTAPTGDVTVALLSFTTLASGNAPLSAGLMSPSALSSALQLGPPPVGPTAIPGTGVPTSVTISAGTPTPTPTAPPSPVAQSFFTLAPCRVIDTRAPDLPILVAGDTRTFVLVGPRCGIPTTAKAVSINVTITGATAGGELRFFPGGTPLPLASTISFRPSQTRANNAIAALGPSGDVAVLCNQASGTVNLIVDVNGYLK